MDISYKLLGSSEVDALKELLAVFGEAFFEIETYQTAVPNDQYLKDFLSKLHTIVLVAIKKGNVVGGLVAYQFDKFEQDRREIYIYDLAVSEGYRRKGVATGLITELRTEAKRRNAYVIFVQADKGDEPAIRLYESLGTREEVYHFDILVNKT